MSGAPTIRLVVVDAQPIFRAGIRQICSTCPDLTLAGEASRSTDALGVCERLRPDLLLIDGALPSVLGVIAQLREHQRGVAVVILADKLDETVLRRGLQLGAVGYLLKQIEAFELIQAIRSAASGLLTLAAEAAEAALNSADQPGCGQDVLSEREQAVLSLLLLGLSNGAIAATLQVSRATVKFHLRNIYSKLGVSSRTEALACVYAERRPRPETPRPWALAVAL